MQVGALLAQRPATSVTGSKMGMPLNMVLSSIVAHLLDQLRSTHAGNNQEDMPGWQRVSATAAVVLNEIVCGAGETNQQTDSHAPSTHAADLLPVAGAFGYIRSYESKVALYR